MSKETTTKEPTITLRPGADRYKLIVEDNSNERIEAMGVVPINDSVVLLIDLGLQYKAILKSKKTKKQTA
jgi:hypothetical protein